MCEPEVFPGLIYRMQEPKTVFLLFSTGKFVCTGTKAKETVGAAVDQLVKDVKSLGLVMTEEHGRPGGNDEDFI